MLNTEFIVGSIGLAMQIALLAILLGRRLYRRFPFFCSYTIFLVVTTGLGLWIMTHSTRSYFSLYWVFEGTSGVLELLVLQEAFMPSLEMHYEQLPWLRLLPPSVLAVIIGWALWRAVYHPFGHGRFGFDHFAAGAYTFELGVNLLEVVAFLILLKLVRRQGHPLRHPYYFGIVAGLGVYADAVLLPDLARLVNRFDASLRYLPPVAYVAITLAWIVVFLNSEPPHKPATSEEINRRLEEQRRIEEWIKRGPKLRMTLGGRAQPGAPPSHCVQNRRTMGTPAAVPHKSHS